MTSILRVPSDLKSSQLMSIKPPLHACLYGQHDTNKHVLKTAIQLIAEASREHSTLFAEIKHPFIPQFLLLASKESVYLCSTDDRRLINNDMAVQTANISSICWSKKPIRVIVQLRCRGSIGGIHRSGKREIVLPSMLLSLPVYVCSSDEATGGNCPRTSITCLTERIRFTLLADLEASQPSFARALLKSLTKNKHHENYNPLDIRLLEFHIQSIRSDCKSLVYERQNELPYSNEMDEIIELRDLQCITVYLRFANRKAKYQLKESSKNQHFLIRNEAEKVKSSHFKKKESSSATNAACDNQKVSLCSTSEHSRITSSILSSQSKIKQISISSSTEDGCAESDEESQKINKNYNITLFEPKVVKKLKNNDVYQSTAIIKQLSRSPSFEEFSKGLKSKSVAPSRNCLLQQSIHQQQQKHVQQKEQQQMKQHQKQQQKNQKNQLQQCDFLGSDAEGFSENVLNRKKYDNCVRLRSEEDLRKERIIKRIMSSHKKIHLREGLEWLPKNFSQLDDRKQLSLLKVKCRQLEAERTQLFLYTTPTKDKPATSNHLNSSNDNSLQDAAGTDVPSRIPTSLRRKLKIHKILRYLNNEPDGDFDGYMLSSPERKLRQEVNSRREEMQHLSRLIFVYSKMSKMSSRNYQILLQQLCQQMNYKFIISETETDALINYLIALFPSWITIEEANNKSDPRIIKISPSFSFSEVYKFFNALSDNPFNAIKIEGLFA